MCLDSPEGQVRGRKEGSEDFGFLGSLSAEVMNEVHSGFPAMPVSGVVSHTHARPATQHSPHHAYGLCQRVY